jgi:hypothetical protein
MVNESRIDYVKAEVAKFLEETVFEKAEDLEAFNE